MALLQLPDTVLRLILEKLDSYGLQASACTCKTLCSAAQDDLLWQRHCKDAGVLSQGSRLDSNSQDSAIVGARALFMRHLRRRCCECRQPTQYEFRFLGIRLCETCERGNPHRYGLATRAQLMHVRSELECLSSSQCDSLFRQLPSLRLSGFEWFMRCQVLERAEQLAARGAKDETGEDAEGARRDGRRARRVRHGDGDGDDSGDIGGGDVAGASYGHVDAAGCEAPGSEGDEPVQDRATGSNGAPAPVGLRACGRFHYHACANATMLKLVTQARMKLLRTSFAIPPSRFSRSSLPSPFAIARSLRLLIVVLIASTSFYLLHHPHIILAISISVLVLRQREWLVSVACIICSYRQLAS
eukprot:1585504-Pleurochrysis_carterae.AAC.4